MALVSSDSILRVTSWDTQHGTIQVSVALLDRHWEPLREITRAVGPFEDLASVKAALVAELHGWVQTYGLQQHLL